MNPTIDRSPLLGHEAASGHVRLPSGIDVGFIEVAIREEGERRYARWSIAANDHGVVQIRTERLRPNVRGPSIVDLPDDRVAAELGNDIRHSDRAGAADLHISVLRVIPNEIAGKSTLHDFVARQLNSQTRNIVIPDLEARLRASFDPILKRLGPERLSLGLNIPPRQDGISLLSMPVERMRAIHDFLKACPWVAELALTDLKRLVRIDLSAPDKAATALLAGFAIPPAAARRMGPHTGRLGPGMLKLLKSIPVDWVPTADDREGWAALQATSYLLQRSDIAGITRAVASAKGRWPEFLARIAKAARRDPVGIVEGWAQRAEEARSLYPLRVPVRDDATEALRNAVGGAFDMTRAWLNTISRIRPDGDFSAIRDLSSDMVIGARTLPALLEVSERWHRQASAANALDREKIEWPKLFPMWTHPETDTVIFEIPNSHQLAAEGMKGTDLDGKAGLNHCVGNQSYAIGCATGHTRILALRRDGERLSSAEIELRAEDGKPKVRQHRGFGNRTPEQAAISALGAYVTLPDFLEAAETPIDEARSPGFVLSFEETFESWRPYLAGAWRTMTVEEALARIEALPRNRHADLANVPIDFGGFGP